VSLTDANDRCRSMIPAAAVILFFAFASDAQTTSEPKQLWPDLNVTFELGKNSALQTTFEKHDGEDAANRQWKLGVLVTHRVWRIVKPRADPAEENKYNLVIGAGYQFIKTGEGTSAESEHRLLLQSTPKHNFGLGLLVQDRNLLEFRWKSGTYDFRYRNKLTIDRPFKIQQLSFIPYASGELFWDRNHHSWNENQYAFGVQWPYKKSFRLDTYYLRQNCTTCSLNPVNVFGLTLNFFVRPLKRH
jgi:uncharacterized protein DUF2490